MGNWALYLGVFLCCTGVGLIPGIILIFAWGITQLTAKPKESSNTINNYYYELPAEIERDFVIDGDKMQDFSNIMGSKHSMHKYKKDAYSDTTREKMK